MHNNELAVKYYFMIIASIAYHDQVLKTNKERTEVHILVRIKTGCGIIVALKLN